MKPKVVYITLYRGTYQPVCACGSGYLAMTLSRMSHKVVPYCFFCKQYTLEYKKIMIEDLTFGYNWNGKLNCNCFTTIRMHNPRKYQPGNKLNVVLQGKPKGTATVLEVKQFRLDKLNEFTARIDTGYPLEECRKMIREMYKNKPLVNFETQLFDLCPAAI